MNRMARFTISAIVGVLGLVACSEGSPLEPRTDASSPAPTLGLTLPVDSLEVVSEVVSVVEVNEIFFAFANPDTIPLPIVPPLLSSANGLTPSFSTSSNGDRDGDDGWTSTTANQQNPCTGEDIQFNYKTRVENRRKTYRDGTVRDESRVTSYGKGVTTAPIPGVKYFGYEDDYSRTYQGPRRNEDLQEQRTIYEREGNKVPDDDFYFFRKLHIIYNPDGSIREVKTEKTKFQCK
jgi:hypothetical protein